MHPRPPPPDYWYISFFFLVGPDPLHEIAVTAFSRSPLGCADTFSFQYLPSTPRISQSIYPLSPRFLAVAFPFLLSLLLLLSCTRQTPLWTVPLLGLVNSFIFARLRYPILLQLALLLFSPTQPYQLWRATSFLARSCRRGEGLSFVLQYRLRHTVFMLPETDKRRTQSKQKTKQARNHPISSAHFVVSGGACITYMPYRISGYPI